MPQTDFREKTGKFYNKMNEEKYGPKITQEKLNFIADTIGQQPTREALLSPTGILYILSILQNLEWPLEEGPARENAVQDTSAVFEANTVVETRREKDKIRIDSFLSSSTVNTTRVSQLKPMNRTGKSDIVQESSSGSSNYVYFLTDEVHNLSLDLHKIAYDIKDLSNCTTEKETFQLGGTIEKTHFNTICQSATAKSDQMNKRDPIQSEEIKHFSFASSLEKKNGKTDSFSSEEVAQILKKNFQALFEKEQGQSHNFNDNVTSPQASFWEELTETFSSFFSQFEQQTYSEQQENTSSNSIMDCFLSLVMRTFSVHYENQGSVDQKRKPDVSWLIHSQDSNHSSTIESTKSKHSTLEQKEFVLKEDEVFFLTKLSQLTSELATTLDGFVQKIIPTLGAEAKLVSEPILVTTAETISIDEQSSGKATADLEIKQVQQMNETIVTEQLTSTRFPASTVGTEAKPVSEPTLVMLAEETIPIDEQSDQAISDLETAQVQKINETIVTDQLIPTRFPEPLPLFFYDSDLFQRKNETSNVNKKLKAFFMKEKLAKDTTSDVELLDIAQKWIENKELDKLERKHFLAYTILENYGMENVRWGEFISAGKLQDIFLQWKTNTLFEDYTYKEITNETIQHDLSEIDPAFIMSFNEYKKESDCIFAEFMKGVPYTIPNTQLLSPIYHEDSLFRARGKTEDVNEEVWHFLVKQKFSKDLTSSRELVQKVQEWIFSGEDYAAIIESQRQVAELICGVYGVTTENMSPAMARLYLLQWEDNNAQVGYSFREVQKEKDDEVTTDGITETENLEKKITDFIQENGIEVSQPNKQLLPNLDERQKEDQRIKIAFLLTDNGMPCAYNGPKQLVQAVIQWLLLEVNSESVPASEVNGNISEPLNPLEMEENSPEVSYAFKLKQLANVLLEKEERAEISEELASDIVGEWLTDTTKEDNLLQEFRVKNEGASRTVPSVWQSPKLLRKVEEFFRKEKLLPSGRATKETILLAAGKWLMPENYQNVFHKGNLQAFAKILTKELKFYGRKGEEISDNVAEMMVNKWVFENVLGGSLTEYLAKQMVEASDPSTFTVSNLKNKINGALSDFNYRIPLDEFREQAREQEHNFDLLWSNLVQMSLPVDINFLDEKESITHSELLPQLIGGKLLEFVGNHTEISESQKKSLGEAYMDTVSEKKQLSFGELQAIFPAALLATAQLEPDSLREAFVKGNYKEFALNTFISYCRAGYFKILEEQKALNTVFQSYQKSLLNWRSKRALAEEAIQICYNANAQLIGETPLHPLGRPPFHQVTREEAMDYYLSGENPCPTLNRPLPVLEEKYEELTNNAADAYMTLDRKLIEIALTSMNATDSQFIFSRETQIYEASASIRKETATTQGYPTWKNVPLKNIDLFMAKQGQEERIYGLKKLGKEQGYAVYQVDKNPKLYNKYEFFSEKYVRIRDRLEVNGKKDGQRFSNMHYQSMSVQEIFSLILSVKHRDDMYERLYKEGNEKTKREKQLDTLLGFVPFYDCVTGIIEKDVKKAAPSCVIDAILLIPVVGEVIALTAKFGLGVARELIKGGLKSVLKNSKYFIPTRAESLKIGVALVQYIDPGIESIADIRKLLIKLKKLIFKGKSKESYRNIGKNPKRNLCCFGIHREGSLAERWPRGIYETCGRSFVCTSDKSTGRYIR